MESFQIIQADHRIGHVADLGSGLFRMINQPKCTHSRAPFLIHGLPAASNSLKSVHLYGIDLIEIVKCVSNGLLSTTQAPLVMNEVVTMQLLPR
jgi:hypothetical protein